MSDDLATLDATAQADLIRSGQASPLELVDAAIARVKKVNPELNAVIHPLFDKARDQARGELPDGPFRGVPILFKDLLCAVEGDPYHEGSKYLKDVDFHALHTDNLARKYLDAGFVCIGRTNTPEFGLVPTTEPQVYGPARNPWNTQHSTGGSSGGSAASVAAGLVPVAHGNDGGGSIRIPAACCGLVGLKPSRGRTSIGPFADHLINILPVEGCLSRSVRDTAAVLDAVSGPFPGDGVIAPPPVRPFVQEVGADPGRLRIGFLTRNTLGTGGVDPACVGAVEETARLLESLGHHVEERHPEVLAMPGMIDMFTTLWSVSIAGVLTAYGALTGREATVDDVEPLTWELSERGRSTAVLDAMGALASCVQLSRALAGWWEFFDLLLTPTLASPPVPLGRFHTPDDPWLGFQRAAEYCPFTPPFNVTGQPAVSLPLSQTADGLPVGVQLVAAYGREDVLLRVAAQLEAASPWAGRRPPVHA